MEMRWALSGDVARGPPDWTAATCRAIRSSVHWAWVLHPASVVRIRARSARLRSGHLRTTLASHLGPLPTDSPRAPDPHIAPQHLTSQVRGAEALNGGVGAAPRHGAPLRPLARLRSRQSRSSWGELELCAPSHADSERVPRTTPGANVRGVDVVHSWRRLVEAHAPHLAQPQLCARRWGTPVLRARRVHVQHCRPLARSLACKPTMGAARPILRRWASGAAQPMPGLWRANVLLRFQGLPAIPISMVLRLGGLGPALRVQARGATKPRTPEYSSDRYKTGWEISSNAFTLTNMESNPACTLLFNVVLRPHQQIRCVRGDAAH